MTDVVMTSHLTGKSWSKFTSREMPEAQDIFFLQLPTCWCV